MFDCVVVGAGPAGAMAAYKLSKEGNLKVLLLEKETLPRYKTCAGAVSGLAAAYLDFDFAAVVEDVINHIRVAWTGSDSIIDYTPPTPVAQLVMRDKFDSLLVQKAVAAGTTLHDGEKVTGLELEPEVVRVRTSYAVYEAPVVIGADGAGSIISRQSKLFVPRTSGIGLEVEAAASAAVLEQWAQTVLVCFGRPPRGYAWVFPKAGILSVGLGTFSWRRHNLLKDLHNFLDRLGIPFRREEVKAHPIPLAGPDRQFCRPRLLLAGDAAGLADPLSGEGIAHALHSGKLAAQSVLSALETGDFSMASYQTAVEERINSDLRIARQLASTFYKFPGLFFHLFESNNDVLRWYFELVRGNHRYSEVWGLVKNLIKSRNLIREWRRRNQTSR